MTKDLFILTNEQQRVLKKFKWNAFFIQKTKSFKNVDA